MKLIKHFEGYRDKAYQDMGGVWTIGYGFTRMSDGKPVRQGDTITMHEAEKLLEKEVNERLRMMGLPEDMPDHRKEALVSFHFNLGHGSWMRSTLRKKVLANPENPNIRDEFMRWVYVNGKRVKGLERRRKAEADLYFTGSW